MAIPDPTWRAIACDKLVEERFNFQVAATFATLAPAPTRGRVVRALVANEVLYDYLDGVSEHSPDGQHLYDAFETALGVAEHGENDYFADLGCGDGGYLHEAATTCRDAFRQLPAAAAVTVAAREAAVRCGQTQTLTHRISDDGCGPLRERCEQLAARHRTPWWGAPPAASPRCWPSMR